MARSGPIVIVEDDIDDQELITEVLKDLGVTNELILFERTFKAFEYLKTTASQPLIIICDINLPAQNGLEFKRQIDEDPQLRHGAIPFIFLSTNASKSAVDEAYKTLVVQGFFQKCSSIQDLKKTLSIVIDYWKICRHPNSEF